MAVDMGSAVQPRVGGPSRQNLAHQIAEGMDESHRVDGSLGKKHWSRGTTYAFLALLVLLQAVWGAALVFSAVRLLALML